MSSVDTKYSNFDPSIKENSDKEALSDHGI